MAFRFKTCAGAGTHTFKASRIERIIVGIPVDTGTVNLRHATTDDNIIPFTTSGAVPYDIEVGLDFPQSQSFELVITQAQTATVIFDG